MGATAAYIIWRQCFKAHALFGISSSKKEVLQTAEDVRWGDIRRDIVELLESNSDYDDGSYGPLLVRLAWHQCGTYSQYAKVIITLCQRI